MGKIVLAIAVGLGLFPTPAPECADCNPTPLPCPPCFVCIQHGASGFTPRLQPVPCPLPERRA